MRLADLNFLRIGPRLTLSFAVLITLILGGNGFLLWQFHIARVQTDRLTAANLRLIAVLRLQRGLFSFDQRLNELEESHDSQTLTTQAGPLLENLLNEIQQKRKELTQLSSRTGVDPSLVPTLDSDALSLKSELDTITRLARVGDWDAVRLRLANTATTPLEAHTTLVVGSTDHAVSEELAQTVQNMETVQRTIFVLVPTMAISTFCIAALFGWAITRRVIELRMEERLSERTRISRDLHDTFLQTIQGSKLVADDALDRSMDPARMRRVMEQLSIWLGQATEEGRAALNSLRASATETNDLAEAFRRAIEECRMQSSMNASLSVVGIARNMHPIVRDEVYRIGYEATRNACLHSQASQLQVELTYAHDLSLRVSDNGIGMDPAVVDRGREGHFGIQGMRERAARIVGKLTVVSSASSGTEVKLVVPGGIVYREPASDRRIFTARIKSLFKRTEPDIRSEP